MGSADKINILVVDDLPAKLLLIEAGLRELGQNVITARSGEEALGRLAEYEFAVILLDVNMPGMGGLETAALIRRRKKTAHVPIIFITASADEMQIAQAYSLGAVDYIFSPVLPEVLRAKVRVFVELFHMAQQVRQQADERVALAREQTARAAAEEATRRSIFLAEASKVLASSLDYEATLRGLLRLTVPYLGDLGAITHLDDQGLIRQTELAWVGPSNQPCMCLIPDPEGLNAHLAAALQRVLNQGTTDYLPDAQPSAGLPWVALNPEQRRTEPAPDFALRSVLIIPLLARGRVLGALSLAMGPSGRRYNSSDRALAEDLAGRAAIAIDNARLYREVQEADHRKNEFLSMLAHELRNPLAPIRNAVQLLRQCGQQPELLAIRDMIDRQVQHLVRLVDDLLDISRITRGKIRLQKEPVDVAAIVARAVETCRPTIDARGHTLTVTLPPEPLRLQGDSVRLAQVLDNLLNNSAKYTEEGGRIWLTAAQEGEEVVLRVRDTGVGIPAEMLASVFDLFTQVDRTLDRSQGGLGIGLTLVRRLVEMHGGRVQAASAGPNQGSEFTVRLPLLMTEESAQPESVDGAANACGNGHCRILVVDDNIDAADSLALLLRMSGHEVHVSHDGLDALKAYAKFQPQAVLLDIGLPGMDGYEVARHLRSQPTTEPPLLVALTGYGQPEDIRHSMEAGFDHHFVKPADLTALTAVFAAVGSAS